MKRKKNGLRNPTYFGDLIPFIKKGGMKLFLHYHMLIMKKALGFKTFKIDSRNICTTNSTITVGYEYQFRSGCSVKRVIVERVWFKHFFLYISLYLIDEKRSMECWHTLLPVLYSGMWRLWDKDHYDIQEWMENIMKKIDYDALNNLPIIEIP